MRKPRLRVGSGVLATAVALLAAAAVGHNAEASSGLIPDGATPTVDILYTGDVIGFVDPCG